MARRRKRKSRRRQEGRRILECVPQYSIESGEDKPVTAARKYIHAAGILPPALVLVKRNEHTTDRYFWAEKGLFGAQYVEENHFLFPSLRAYESQAERLSVGVGLQMKKSSISSIPNSNIASTNINVNSIPANSIASTSIPVNSTPVNNIPVASVSVDSVTNVPFASTPVASESHVLFPSTPVASESHVLFPSESSVNVANTNIPIASVSVTSVPSSD